MLLAADRYAVVTISAANSLQPMWQTLFGWPATSDIAVPVAVSSNADRRAWAARLDGAVRQTDRSILLVVDGVGCAAATWWARLSPSDYVARIGGAILFPGDTVAPSVAKLFASPGDQLPFSSLVIRPGATSQAIDSSIASWGGQVISCPRARNRASGLASWQHAQRLFLRLTSRVVEHDVARANILAMRR